MSKPEFLTIEPSRYTLPSSLVHELRTPLNLIIGYTEMMLEQAAEENQNAFLPDLQRTRNAGKRLLALLDDHFQSSGATERPTAIPETEEEREPSEEESATAGLLEEADEAVADPPERGFLLVVDDVEENRNLLSRGLKRQGYAVVTAGNGPEALELLRGNESVDLVLLDILMPEMDGYEVLRLLKADEKLRHIPVIMISALRELDSVVRCLEMGAVDYLDKPFNATLLEARINACMEKKRALQSAEELAVVKQLLGTSRQAGMAEVATSILHNVGNVLNSVNVSGDFILDKIQRSKIKGFTQAVALLEEHKDELPAFFDHNPKGNQLLGYLGRLKVTLVHEQEEVLTEIRALISNISHIKAIIAMQQDYARVSGLIETIHVEELVEDAVRLNIGVLKHHRIKLQREYSQMPPISVDKHKLLQILVNLISNANHAFDQSSQTAKLITLRILNDNKRVEISVIDNGIGIPAENLVRIFSHGFTTRKDGHGFGLHSGSLSAKELGGTLRAFSEGSQRGSTFTLELPLVKES